MVISHIAPKALDRIKDTAKEKVKAIQHSSDEIEEYKVINDYNSFIMGIHNYYRMATAASPDIQRLAFEIKIAIKKQVTGTSTATKRSSHPDICQTVREKQGNTLHRQEYSPADWLYTAPSANPQKEIGEQIHR